MIVCAEDFQIEVRKQRFGVGVAYLGFERREGLSHVEAAYPRRPCSRLEERVVSCAEVLAFINIEAHRPWKCARVSFFQSLHRQPFPKNCDKLAGLMKLLDWQIKDDDRRALSAKAVFGTKVRLSVAKRGEPAA